eukprot:g49397.t1
MHVQCIVHRPCPIISLQSCGVFAMRFLFSQLTRKSNSATQVCTRQMPREITKKEATQVCTARGLTSWHLFESLGAQRSKPKHRAQCSKCRSNKICEL